MAVQEWIPLSPCSLPLSLSLSIYLFHVLRFFGEFRIVPGFSFSFLSLKLYTFAQYLFIKHTNLSNPVLMGCCIVPCVLLLRYFYSKFIYFSNGLFASSIFICVIAIDPLLAYTTNENITTKKTKVIKISAVSPLFQRSTQFDLCKSVENERRRSRQIINWDTSIQYESEIDIKKHSMDPSKLFLNQFSQQKHICESLYFISMLNFLWLTYCMATQHLQWNARTLFNQIMKLKLFDRLQMKIVFQKKRNVSAKSLFVWKISSHFSEKPPWNFLFAEKSNALQQHTDTILFRVVRLYFFFVYENVPFGPIQANLQHTRSKLRRNKSPNARFQKINSYYWTPHWTNPTNNNQNT